MFLDSEFSIQGSQKTSTKKPQKSATNRHTRSTTNGVLDFGKQTARIDNLFADDFLEDRFKLVYQTTADNSVMSTNRIMSQSAMNFSRGPIRRLNEPDQPTLNSVDAVSTERLNPEHFGSQKSKMAKS